MLVPPLVTNETRASATVIMNYHIDKEYPK